jgi:hypothetical protein
MWTTRRALESFASAALRATRQDVPLPSATCAGLRVDGQAQFNPVAYPFGPARACLGTAATS